MTKEFTTQTKLVNGSGHKKPFGSITTPIYPTVTYVYDSTDQGKRRFLGEEEGFIGSTGA